MGCDGPKTLDGGEESLPRRFVNRDIKQGFITIRAFRSELRRLRLRDWEDNLDVALRALCLYAYYVFWAYQGPKFACHDAASGPRCWCLIVVPPVKFPLARACQMGSPRIG